MAERVSCTVVEELPADEAVDVAARAKIDVRRLQHHDHHHHHPVSHAIAFSHFDLRLFS